MSNEPAQNVTGRTAARARRDPWLRAIAVAAVTVLVFGLVQEPVARLGRSSLKQHLLEPIEINPDARLPLLSKANLHALWFFDRNEGLAAGESATLLRTTDGGVTWEPARVAPALDNAVGIYAFHFPAGSESGLAGGRFSTVLKTPDKGVTWKPMEDGEATKEPAQQGPPPAPQQLRLDQSHPDIVSLTLTKANRLLTASSVGVGMGGSWSNLMVRTDTRGIFLGENTVTFAGPAGLNIHYPPDAIPATATEEFRGGTYTAMAGRNDMVLAAGDRFRIERIVSQGKPSSQGTLAANYAPDDRWIGAEKLRVGEDAKPVIHGCSLAVDAAVGWAVGDGGAIWLVKPTRLVAGQLVDSQGNRMVDSSGRGLAVGGPEALSVQRKDVPGFKSALYAVWAFSRDEAIVAGENGAIFRTRDGGATWAAMTQNCWPLNQRGSWWMKIPAPWCWLALMGLAGAGWTRWQRLPAMVEERDAVAEELTSDRPLEPGEVDRLGFDPLVQGLSRYLRNTATQAPLTLAVTGAWGAGKSSFMNLLRSDLDEKGLRTVWFNAWHHQQEPQILAPLLSAIQAAAAPPLLTDQFALAVRFRWRLLWRRIWPPGKLVLWAAVVAGFLLGIGAALKWKMPTDVLADLMEKLAGGKAWEAASGLGFGTSALGAIILLVWRGLQTFGVNPADLLATEVGKTSEHALSAQSAFRREFAEQFSEVTAALEPYPLVIFIDDLDRCEVPKVFQILEAINYLVSSGGCYVVLGMSEERVRDAVALGFKDLPSDFGEAELPAGAKAGDESDEPKARLPQEPWTRQRELAQNYLEKLVQLRIDVPRPDVEAAKRIVRTEAARAAEAPANRWAAFVAWWRNYGFNVAAVAGVLLVLSVAFQAGGWIAPLLRIPETPVEGEKQPNNTSGANTGQSASTTGTRGNEGGTGTPAPDVHLYKDRGLASVAPQAGHDGRLGWIAGGLLVLLIVGAVWLGESLWRKRLNVVVKDSSDFNEACEQWTDALLKLQGDKLTPRGLKRFKNRVRFYAMMRSDDGTEGLLPGASDASLVALGAIEMAGLVPPGQIDRGELDVQRLMKLPIDEALKEAAVEAAGLLKEDTEGSRKMRATKKALKRA